MRKVNVLSAGLHMRTHTHSRSHAQACALKYVLYYRLQVLVNLWLFSINNIENLILNIEKLELKKNYLHASVRAPAPLRSGPTFYETNPEVNVSELSLLRNADTHPLNKILPELSLA